MATNPDSTNACSQCHAENPNGLLTKGKAYPYKEKLLCPDCMKRIRAKYAEETFNPNMGRAILYGIAAAALSSACWYTIEVVTGLELSIISIAAGIMIGLGIHLGSGRKRGMRLQILSVTLAAVSTLFVEWFAAQHFASVSAGRAVFIGILEPAFWKSSMNLNQFLIYFLGLVAAYGACKPRTI